MESALDCALLLAKKFDSWIEGFPLRPAVADMVAMDPDAGLTMVAVKENDADMVRQAEELFRSFMRAARRATPGRRNCAARRPRLHPGRGVRIRAERSRLCRQLRPRLRRHRAGAAGEEWQSPSMVTLESALFESGRPVLIAPPTSPASLATHVLIAWNRCTEQARTTAFAMPLLRLAERVTILTVEGSTVAGPSGARHGALAGDARHRRRDPSPSRPGKVSAGETILKKAAELGLRPHRQGRVHAKPPAPDDFRRHHAAYSW